MFSIFDSIWHSTNSPLTSQLKNLREEIKAEEEKIDDLWRRKKAGTKWTDLNDDYL